MTNTPETIVGISSVPEHQRKSYNMNYGAHKVGIQADEVTDYYNKWTSYDQDIAENYLGPKYTAQFTKNYLKPESNPKILDVAAGTGFVAVELNKLGFNNLDALEPAKDLLSNSPNKHLYKKCIFDILGPKSVVDINSDEYDAVVVAGAFGEGHIPCSGLNDMIRVVKPGGYIIIAMREEYLTYVKEYINRLEPYMKELESVGKWRRKERANVENYSFSKKGLVHVFEVTESGYTPFVSNSLSS